MSTNPQDYLYNKQGPWPQPNPAMDLWPAVVHLPQEEWTKFEWNIGLRYAAQALYYAPVALTYAIRHRGLKPVSDTEFADFMCARSFSKFQYEAGTKDIETFLPGFDMTRLRSDRKYFITDLFLMRHIPSQDGQYVAVTVSLFEMDERGAARPVAIYIESRTENTKTTVYPEDGSAWELSKYYALLGCAYRIVFSIHSTLHFPMDALNAITKTALPKENLVFQLLYPHLEFSLELNLVVQTSKTSPIKNHQEYPYTGVTGTAEEIAGLFEDAHRGVPERGKAYPPFHFTLKPTSERASEYFRFQMEYYNCIFRFVKEVVKKLTPDDKQQLVEWADYIAPFSNRHAGHVLYGSTYLADPLRHFPYGNELFREYEGEEIITWLLTMIIWDLSVGHAGDHYDFGMMDIDKVPMRLRLPAPDNRQIHYFDRRKLRSFNDTFRHRMEWRMFYIPTNVTLLHNINYNFADPELQALNRRFLQDLKDTERGLADKAIRNFLPLRKISRSIQY